MTMDITVFMMNLVFLMVLILPIGFYMCKYGIKEERSELVYTSNREAN